MPGKSTRVYESLVRRRQADDTRRRIADAARKLLEAKGYSGMTIDAIARAAGVAAQTVYAVFRSKTGILAELLDQASFGPDYHELVRQALETEGPAARLRFAARLARQIHDAQSSAFDVLRGAGVVAPDLARLEKDRERKRYDAQEGMISYLHRARALRRDLDSAAARDLLWTLTGREIYRMLVRDRGWTPQAYEDWLGDMLTVILLKSESIKPKKSRKVS